jgi:uncharacterized protein
MITVNVAQLLMSPQGTTRRLSIDEEPSVLGEASIVGPVRAECSLMRTGYGILADCQFQAAVQAECARCLEPATMPVAGRLQEEFLPTVDVRTGAPLAEAPEEGAFAIDENHLLDLGEAIRQHILMETPLQPLCRPDCQGLCPSCGSNLNEGRCDCAPTDPSSPFSALEQLFDTSDEPPPGASARPDRRSHGRGPQA